MRNLRFMPVLLLAVVLNCEEEGGCGGEPPPTDPFTEVDAGFEGVYNGVLAWGDYDNDGDLDLAVAGLTGGGGMNTLYQNLGNGSFAEAASAPSASVLAWGDYDGDGDLDILQFGAVYRNDEGTFSEAATGLLRAREWGDFDNDGDLDLVAIGGWDGAAETNNSKIYGNQGDGTFVDVPAGLDVSLMSWHSVAPGDYDEDGDLDLMLLGVWSSSDPPFGKTEAYKNSAGTFTEVTTDLPGVHNGTAAWGDYDSDGDLDLVLAGERGEGADPGEIYRNDGNEVFTNETNAVLPALYHQCAVAWGDYDNDGDLDLAIAGRGEYVYEGEYVSGRLARIYRNDGHGVFSDISAGLTGVSDCDLAWADYDGDGDLDLAVAGIPSDSSYPVTKLYRNEAQTANTPPTAPTGLAEDVPGAGPCEVTFSWSAATDAETPQQSLTYNLRVWTDDGSTVHEVMPAHTDPVTGKRGIPAMGNVQHNTSWTLTLPSGGYYWSVQAVDSGFMGSPWAAEQTVTVP